METSHRDLRLSLASCESLEPLLRVAVDGLAEQGAALARVWLRDPHPGASALRLAASAGRPRVARSSDWTRIDGAFRSFHVASGTLGASAAKGEHVVVRDVQRAPRRIARPEWARREGIHGFAALPLARAGRVLGVLAVFRRDALDDGALEALSDVGAHLAAGIARALAFSNLALRTEALERECGWLRESLAQERAGAAARRGAPAAAGVRTEAELRDLERENLRRALAESGGRIYGRGGAAERLGVRPTTLASRIRALDRARGGSGRSTRSPRSSR